VSEWHDIRSGSLLRQRLDAPRTVIGTFVRIPAAEVVEVCAHSGFDFVVIDAEHTPMNPQTSGGLVRAAEACAIPALVRLHDSRPENIARTLETGASGLHVPHVRSEAHATEVIEAAKYPPEGTRGLATNRASAYGLRGPLASYTQALNRETIMVLQVESMTALEDIGRIAAVPGCNVVFLGLTDLTIELGITADYGHPTLIQAIEHASRAAAQAGVPLGAPAASVEMAEDLVSRGVGYVTSNDIRLLSSAAQSFTTRLRR
jgi:4-hydroxy-2-oxoheptanedioate aldolase